MKAEELTKYVDILKTELVPALGCTEPIAIALASAKAASLLDAFPEKIDVQCSSNILKNVLSVTVPNSGGMRGVEPAAILGALSKKPEKLLEVLEGITDEDRELTKKCLIDKVCSCCRIEDDAERLMIRVKAYLGSHIAETVIAGHHTDIVYVALDGDVLFSVPYDSSSERKSAELAKQEMTLEKIIEFANTVQLEEIQDTLESQIRCNSAISEVGLSGIWGAQVGRTLLEAYGTESLPIRARAHAAAASEARMSGCCMPVVINSGSGNQGITVSVPVIEYAKALCTSREQLYRAIIISNLVSIHLKSFIGDLSAFCGAVTAACGAGVAISYLQNGTLQEMTMTIETTLAAAGGIICDGAKSSCAAKIATALEAAITAQLMSQKNRSFQPGEGFIREDPEKTFSNMGRIGREGMSETDSVIFDIMLNEK